MIVPCSRESNWLQCSSWDWQARWRLAARITCSQSRKPIGCSIRRSARALAAVANQPRAGTLDLAAVAADVAQHVPLVSPRSDTQRPAPPGDGLYHGRQPLPAHSQWPAGPVGPRPLRSAQPRRRSDRPDDPPDRGQERPGRRGAALRAWRRDLAGRQAGADLPSRDRRGRRPSPADRLGPVVAGDDRSGTPAGTVQALVSPRLAGGVRRPAAPGGLGHAVVRARRAVDAGHGVGLPGGQAARHAATTREATCWNVPTRNEAGCGCARSRPCARARCRSCGWPMRAASSGFASRPIGSSSACPARSAPGAMRWPRRQAKRPGGCLPASRRQGQFVTFEFKEQIVGWPHFTIEAPEGTVVELMCQEAHDPAGPEWLDSQFFNWSRFICRKGVNRFEPFDFESLALAPASRSQPGRPGRDSRRGRAAADVRLAAGAAGALLGAGLAAVVRRQRQHAPQQRPGDVRRRHGPGAATV